MKKRIKNYFLLLPVVLLLVVMTVFCNFAIHRMESYIACSGETNMIAVMEQMAQTYDLQLERLYDRLQWIDRNLLQYQSRSIQMEEHRDLFASIIETDNASGQILFMKDNGQIMTWDGEEGYLDVQYSTLLKLQQKERIAQSVTWTVNMQKESLFVLFHCSSKRTRRRQ